MALVAFLFLGVLLVGTSVIFPISFSPDVIYLSTAMIALFFGPIAYLLALQPLQKASGAKLMEMFRANSKVRVFIVGSFLFPLLSFFIYSTETPLLFSLWLALFWGYSLICIRFLQVVTGHLSSSIILELYQEQALRNFRAGKPYEIYPWLDILIETGVKGMKEGRQTESEEAAHALMRFTKTYFDEQQMQALHTDDLDKLTENQQYTFMYLSKGFTTLFHTAIQTDSHQVSGRVLAIIGKFAMASARVDPAYAKDALYLFDQFYPIIQERRLKELAIQMHCILYEVLKSWATEETSLEEVLLTTIQQLEKLSLDLFKTDKTIPLTVLVRPFHDLYQVTKEKEEITKELGRIIEDFKQLAEVVRHKDIT